MKGLSIAECSEHGYPEPAVSVRLAAIWLAYDAILERYSCRSVEIYDAILDRYSYKEPETTAAQDRDSDRMLEFVEQGSVNLFNLDTVELPAKWWESEAAKFQKALLGCIDLGQIKPNRIQREFPSLEIDPDRTLLRLKEIENAMLIFGLGTGEMLHDAFESLNSGLANAVLGYFERVRGGLNEREVIDKARNMSEGQIIDLIAENNQLVERLRKLEATKELAGERPDDSALLLIAKALEIYQGGEPRRYTQDRFVKEVAKGDENVRGLGDRTVKGLLADAKKLLADRRRS